MEKHCRFITRSLCLPFALIIGSCARPDAGNSAPDDSVIPVQSANGAVGIVQQEATAVSAAVTEAPTGYDNQTNGFLGQGDFDDVRGVFEETDDISKGLGPVYNAQSCRECHQNPVTGAASQISEFRAGHFNGSSFVDHPGGSLINDRAIDATIQERLLAGNEVTTFRITTNTLGDGFVECIDSNTLAAIAAAQPAAQRGTLIQVPVAEQPGAVRAGRFGWKNQNSSLLSFSGDAYLNEMGITNRLNPTENTSNGNSVAAFDHVADPEDVDNDIDEFAAFMRSSKAPPRDAARAATAQAQRGQALFSAIGCATCHVASINTAPAGTVINGGAFTVPPALGDKTIHPYSDFLLHDVGTGDGIVQNGGQGTRNQLRTPPLWGVRVRPRLMHDGASTGFAAAINRHGNQGATARANFQSLSSTDQTNVILFLNSL